MIPLSSQKPKPLTPEQCVAVGGHCWQAAPFVTTDAVFGGRSRKTEECRRCPALRHGVSREPWEWTYTNGTAD